jgi:sn-1 stearoyl-lipid 9-desaturase
MSRPEALDNRFPAQPWRKVPALTSSKAEKIIANGLPRRPRTRDQALTSEFVGVRATPRPPEGLALPAGVRTRRVDLFPAIFLTSYHLLALLAFVPWFFSWTGVVLLLIGDFVFGVLGINLCYHRLLTHRGFRCPKWFEHLLAVLGFCCLQDTPARWVAVHRRHHQHADEAPDPHSPLAGFVWGHLGWIVIENTDLNRLGIYERYARDLLRDPFYKRLERGPWQIWIVLLSWAVFFFGGFGASLLIGGTAMDSVQFGLSLLLWGVILRTVVVWHQTWAVNSVTHLWGYRSYETDEASRNNVFVGIISNGEGWHNNHHADPRSAKHGHRWWELDTTYLAIRLLALVGLARDVAMPNPRLLAQSRGKTLKTHTYREVPSD